MTDTFLKEGHVTADPPVLKKGDILMDLHQTDEAEARKQAMRERMAKVRAAKGQPKVSAASDLELPEFEQRIVPPTRKRHKKKVKARKAVEHKVKPIVSDVNFDGMRHAKLGGNGCPAACGPNCIITGEICAHPDLGGLQSKYLTMPEVKRRYDQALLYLKRLDTEMQKE
jgi:hypothetical protein